MKSSIIFFGSTISLTLIGVLTHLLFLTVSIDMLTNNSLILKDVNNYDFQNFFNSSIYFIIGLALIPTFTFLSKHFLEIKGKFKTLLLSIIILACGGILWYNKTITLDLEIGQQLELNNQVQGNYFLDWLTFGKHFAFGIIVGTIIIIGLGKLKRMLTPR